MGTTATACEPGIGEMIYCQGKTPDLVSDIAQALVDRGSGAVLAARAAPLQRRRQTLSTRLEADQLAAPGAQPGKLDEVFGVQEELVHPAELVDR